jgi:hypothetical protein
MDRPDPLTAAAFSHRHAFQATGDVVLTTGAGPAALANRLVQSVVERRWARATHAMLVAAPGLFLDAGPRQGVALVPADRYAFGPAAGPGLRRRRLAAVLRHPELAASAALRAELGRAIEAFRGGRYNFRLLIGPAPGGAGPGGAFCSELVVAVFARLGWRLVPDRPAHAVLPHTLLRVLPRQGWRDVTELYAGRDGAGGG